MTDNRAGHPPASMEDANFVHQATAGAVAEVMMGQLAAKRATGDPARNLGRLMVTDHSRKDHELNQILQSLSLRPATKPLPEQLAQVQQLQNAPADHFDATYARIFVERASVDDCRLRARDRIGAGSCSQELRHADITACERAPGDGRENRADAAPMSRVPSDMALVCLR
jgi:predicted outer membrane protein